MILLAVFVMLCMATGCGKSGKAPYEATMSKVFMCDDAYTGSIIAKRIVFQSGNVNVNQQEAREDKGIMFSNYLKVEKKILSIILVMAMTIGLLSGCGQVKFVKIGDVWKAIKQLCIED